MNPNILLKEERKRGERKRERRNRKMKKEEGERKWKEEERKEGIEEVLPGMVGHTFRPSYSENKRRPEIQDNIDPLSKR